ncbi:MAG: IclR family transcriptional regulator C-terminal domain-containing protein, partial [Alphaproteobacteria bacterium]|nr:IclR family transcriptional regulator C-terminal domain-containing protein [Alphaproteobacteria bacterium]
AMLAYLDEPALSRVLAQQSFHAFTPNTLNTEQKLRTELGEIRQRGFAYDREEHEPGIICVAVPILTESGRVLGALSVTTSTSRKTLDALEAHVPAAQQAADNIAREAQSWRFPDQTSKPEKIGMA